MRKAADELATPGLLTPKTQKDRALQTCAREFLLLSLGADISPEEAKLFFSLAALALPGKYRFPRAYVDELKRKVLAQALEQWEPDETEKPL